MACVNAMTTEIEGLNTEIIYKVAYEDTEGFQPLTEDEFRAFKKAHDKALEEAQEEINRKGGVGLNFIVHKFFELLEQEQLKHGQIDKDRFLTFLVISTFANEQKQRRPSIEDLLGDLLG